MPYIRAYALKKSFEVGGEQLEVLKGIDLAVEGGEFLCIVGPSGVGKSTLLHILGALDRPTSGEVFYKEMYREEAKLSSLSEGELATFRNKTVGFVFQFHHLLPEFSALENVMMPLLISRRPREEARQRALSALKEVGLEHRSMHRPAQLSGGEQQRAAIARALVGEPRVILADEPTGNLDTKAGEAVYELLRRLNIERGLTVVMVTHNEGLAGRADRVARMVDGRVVSAS